MEFAFLELFMEHTGFAVCDREALREAFHGLGDTGRRALWEAAGVYAGAGYEAKVLDPLLAGISARFGVHRYTLWLLVLICCAQGPYGRWEDKGLFWETFTDLRYKAEECRSLHGVCGNFVGFWYPIFFTDSIVKLGRLEFERAAYPGREAVTVGGLTVKPGDPIYSIHIPSSGEPFTRQARLDAYRRAYEYFGKSPLVCFCESWLLYPPYTQKLPEHSQIRDFAGDFCHIYGEKTEIFDDFWRAFGNADSDQPHSWPEATSFQRMLKGHFLSGGKAGYGMGILVFDGVNTLK